MTVRLATMVHRPGLANADDERVARERPSGRHPPLRGPGHPVLIDDIFDAVLAGRLTDGLVPCPGDIRTAWR
jgi:hypothetical protein